MAGRRRKYKVALTNTERNRLKEVVRDKRTSNTIRNRCRILLALDENQTSATTYDDCAYYLGVSKPTICNVVKCYALEGIDKVLVRNRNINSDNANRKIDGALEENHCHGLQQSPGRTCQMDCEAAHRESTSRTRAVRR